MKIRAMGSADLIYRLNKLLKQLNSSGKVYDNRGGSMEKRLYLDKDDRAFSDLLYRIEDGMATFTQIQNGEWIENDGRRLK
jgi:hypothetical protein